MENLDLDYYWQDLVKYVSSLHLTSTEETWILNKCQRYAYEYNQRFKNSQYEMFEEKDF